MSELLSPVAASRRTFFKRASLGLGAAAVLQSCDSNGGDDNADVVLDFSTDNGVLNYALVLEQLEAEFYVQALRTPFTGITADERAILTDLRDHELIHRDFLKAALGSAAIPQLEFNFSAVNFSNRASVLGTAITFEDLGVAAYNGAGKILRSADLLLIAGKIVSVEARHASAIRDLILNGVRSGTTVGEAGGGLPDVIGADALDRAFEPPMVLAAAGPFVRGTIAVRGL